MILGATPPRNLTPAAVWRKTQGMPRNFQTWKQAPFLILALVLLTVVPASSQGPDLSYQATSLTPISGNTSSAEKGAAPAGELSAAHTRYSSKCRGAAKRRVTLRASPWRIVRRLAAVRQPPSAPPAGTSWRIGISFLGGWTLSALDLRGRLT